MDAKERNQLIEGRETTYEERATWGTCPICGAEPGEWCEPAGTPSLGIPVGGGRHEKGDGVHMARLTNAPRHIRIVEGKM